MVFEDTKAEGETGDAMDSIQPDERYQQSDPARNPALQRHFARRHGAADGDPPHRQEEHFPRPELQCQKQNRRDEGNQQENPHPVAKERRGNGGAERQPALAALGKGVAFYHGRHRVGRSGNIDQHRRYGAAEDAARLAHQLGARVNETLAFAEHSLPLVTASALHAGMAIPAWGCGVDLRFSDLLPISEYRELARRLEVDIAHLGGKQNTGKIEIHKFLREIQQDRGFREVLPAITGSTTSLDTIEMVEPVDHNDF